MFTEKQINHINLVKKIISAKVKQMHETEYFRPVRQKIDFYGGMYVTGGCIASLLQFEEPKDFDIYFTNASLSRDVINELPLEYIADVDDKYHDFLGKDGKMITAMATTMKDKISFITAYCGMPDDVRRQFDFVHCTPLYNIANDKLYISPLQYYCIVNKKLLTNNHNSVKSWRISKFKNVVMNHMRMILL